MGNLTYVFNTVPRPIGVHEFAEALRAISPPRFSTTKQTMRRTVGMAVSGGVDSMALAYLCSQLKRYGSNFTVSDNPISNFNAFVVDHLLREGSTEEAYAVKQIMRDMGHRSDVYQISWKKILASYKYQYKHQKDLPNIESLARRLRYRLMGGAASHRRVASILLAHHEDDQYETVLMRLLQGHGVWGLRGMKAASDIPECEGIHGAYQSGYVDDQKRPMPFYSQNVPRRYYKYVKSELRSDINRLMVEEELKDTVMDRLGYDFEALYQTGPTVPPDLDNVSAEDGGVMIYRPLLGFSKDRLIATCEANGVPWFEDGTNKNPTLTMRNAVRHMCKNYTLPLALQKPAILSLSNRCRKTVETLEAEANRLLAETIIHDLELNVGSVTVQFPEYSLSRFPRDKSSPARRHARILRQREVAGLLIRRLIALVGPDERSIPLANLQNFISRLFPGLSIDADDQSVGPPKAFVVAGVYFVPIEPSSRKPSTTRPSVGALTWYLSRMPYPAHLPIPRFRPPCWAMTPNRGKSHVLNSIKWCKWSRWGYWDGRFWLRTKTRLPYRVVLQPFLRQHAKAFRELLNPDDRDRLAALLKRYAPGKTRYTLPALYLEEPLDLNNVKPRRYYPAPPSYLKKHMEALKARGEWNDDMDTESDHPLVPDVSKMMPIALPTLDIQIQHLENWLEYDIRYRRFDRTTLATAGSFQRSSFPRVSRSGPGVRRRASRRGNR
ncbi:adenine nucleotide alpha hydrolases-like protein [Xylaria nigripes]|nr:adenine nucleotide alpha hydrolases-like protein [Xylaria nigripes]